MVITKYRSMCFRLLVWEFFFFTVTRAKKTEQDEHNNGYNELQSEWNGVRLAKSLLSLFLKGNNCTQRYYDPN